MSGPILILPCMDHYVEEVVDIHGVRKAKSAVATARARTVPDRLMVTGALKTENRSRIIRRASTPELSVRGRFDIPATRPAERHA